MNRVDRVREVMRLEGLAQAAYRRAAGHRTELEREARTELEREGTAPSWRLPNIGTVALPLSKEAPVIADIDALAEWVQQRHPSEIEHRRQVRPAFQAALLQHVTCADGVVIDPETGEVIPGLAVRPGGVPKALTIVASRDAKAILAANADVLLDAILAAEAEPVGHLEPGEVA